MNRNFGKYQDLWERIYRFTLDCTKLASDLPNSTLGTMVRKQLFRCASSVSANYRAAKHGQSKASFIAKLSIVIEESDECEFWLQFIVDTKLLPKNRIDNLLKESNELTSIFIISRKTAQGKK